MWGLEPTPKCGADLQCIFPRMINVWLLTPTINRNNDTSSVLIVCNNYASLKAGQPWLCHVSEDGMEEDFTARMVTKPKTSCGGSRVSHVP